MLADLRRRSPGLAEEASMVAEQLLLLSVSPQEAWSEGLERAAQAYVQSRGRDPGPMVAILEALHAADRATRLLFSIVARMREQARQIGL